MNLRGLTTSVALLACAHNLMSQPNIDKLRAEAWQEWCRDYQQKDTFLLAQPDSLNAGKTFVWHIPEVLETNATMPFYYGIKGHKPAGGYPLFVYMHGSGPKLIEWLTGHKLAMQFEDAPSLYAIPQIPNEGELYRWWQKGKQWVWEKLLRAAFVSGFIDPARVYFFGISEGGYGSQRLASFYADYLAAAGPMAGGEPLRNAPCENLANLPFSLISGEKDNMFYRNKMTENTGRTLDSLALLYPGQYIHRVELQPGRGHGIDYSPTTPWMSQFRRNAQPKSFRWENYEMDGRKRNSFYNIEVLEEDTAAYRTYYEVEIKDNTVCILASDVEYETTYTEPNWNIPFYFKRHLRPSVHSRFRVYLSEQLIDLNKPVIIFINDIKVYEGQIKLKKSSIRNVMRQSLNLWGDPLRIFPAVVEVKI